MHIIKFIELVQDMRTAQKTYFRDRTGTALNTARELEKKVDAMLASEKQPGLFDNNNKGEINGENSLEEI